MQGKSDNDKFSLKRSKLAPHKNLWVNCGMGSFIAVLSGSSGNPPALPEVDDPRRAFDHILIARLLFDE